MAQPSNPNTSRYSKPSVLLHWAIALGIGFNLWWGLQFDGLEAAKAPDLRSIIDLHKSVGITLLGLVLMRVLWRASHRPPQPLPGLQRWERLLSTAVHHLLYLLMFLVPLLGWLHDSAWSAAASHPLVLFHELPFFRLPLFNHMAAATRDHWHALLGEAHGLLAYTLLGALALHVLGALKHQFIDGKPELQRMWFGR